MEIKMNWPLFNAILLLLVAKSESTFPSGNSQQGQQQNVPFSRPPTSSQQQQFPPPTNGTFQPQQTTPLSAGVYAQNMPFPNSNISHGTAMFTPIGSANAFYSNQNPPNMSNPSNSVGLSARMDVNGGDRMASTANGGDSMSHPPQQQLQSGFSYPQNSFPNYQQNPTFNAPNSSLYANNVQSPPQNVQMGTMEIFYTEVNGENGQPQWDIYRQRDNSAKFIKFRYVDKSDGKSKCQWVISNMPKSKDKNALELYFNNNQSIPFYFDGESGMLISPEEAKDQMGRTPKEPPSGHKKLEGKIKWEINKLIANSSPLAPIFERAAVPTEYPSETVYTWAKKALPVHASDLKPGQLIDVKEKEPEKTAEFGKITEQLDDGQNWVKIEVRQGTSRSKFARDLFGKPPSALEEPMVLFFDGSRHFFDKTGSSLSETAWQYWASSTAGIDARRVAEAQAQMYYQTWNQSQQWWSWWNNIGWMEQRRQQMMMMMGWGRNG